MLSFVESLLLVQLGQLEVVVIFPRSLLLLAFYSAEADCVRQILPWLIV